MKKYLDRRSAFVALGVLALAGYAGAQSINVTGTLSDAFTSAPFSVMVSQSGGAPIIPADRLYAWKPGVTYNGGIPARTTICATLNPISGDNAPQIQAAINNCPPGQTVLLGAGTFHLSGKQNSPVINKAITLRGAGAGVTILQKTNGTKPRTNTLAQGTTNMYNGVDDTSYSGDGQPLVWIGTNQDYNNADNSTAVNLTADGSQGSNSIQVASVAGLSVGQIVLIDEASGASWQPVANAPAGSNIKVWAGDRVEWHQHLPMQSSDGVANKSDATGPYDTNSQLCTANQAPRSWPNTFAWFSRYNCTYPSEDRTLNEMKEIASISGNTVTFTSALTISYRVSHHAQLVQYTTNPILGKGPDGFGAGVENMTLLQGWDGGIRFNDAAYCWAKNIEVSLADGNSGSGSVGFDGAFRCEVRDSYIHTVSYPAPGGGGYLLQISRGSTDILVENNIIIDGNKVMVVKAGGAGSVVAYNYADDGWIQGYPWFSESGLNASHHPGPHHVLFEGNYSFKASSDFTWGNNIYQTFFRNYFPGLRRDFNTQAYWAAQGQPTENYAVDSNTGAWWHSFVGNVFGVPNVTTAANGWVYTDPSLACDANGNNCAGSSTTFADCCAIWGYGHDPSPSSGNWKPDPSVISTIIRDGNYDYLTNSQRWHNTPSGFVMPNSLYLTAKPAFFGSNPWPWVNPTTGALNVLPAKQRFDAGTPNSP